MNRHHLKILLVDDDEQDHTTLRDLLAQIESWQCDLDWASSEATALETLQADQPDICLLNCRIGEQEGLAFIHQVVEAGVTMPLIFLMHKDDQDLARQALEAGAIDYLIKDQIDSHTLERSMRYASRCKAVLETQIEQRTVHLTATIEQLEEELNGYRQTAEQLQKSERQYRTLFDVDVYSIEVLDAQGNIIDCNTRFQHLLGYTRDEIIGHHTTAFATPRSKRMLEKKLPLLREQGYIEGEVELIREDGSTLLVWRRSRAIYDKRGTLRKIVAYSRDITERMKAVRQISTLARALEQSPLAIMVTDIAGNIEYANLEFTELTGYAYEEVVGRNLRNLPLGQESAQDYEALWAVLTADNEWQGELQSLRRDGETYWESVLISPMFNEQGTLTHFIVIREDITTRKEAEVEAFRSQHRIGDLMTEHISDLTSANETLRRQIAERERAEQALRRSRARFKAQYKGIPIPTYSWQRVGNDFLLIDYNNTAERSTNNRISELMGKPASEIFNDRPQVMADFSRCFTEKTLVKREAPYRLVSTGETKYFVTTYNFVPPNLVIVHIQDITEYKQAEEELEKCHEQLETLTAGQTGELTEIREELTREIVRREEAEQALKASEEKVKQVIGNIDDRLREQYRSIPIPTYSWQMIGGEFVLIDFNDAAAEAMGRIVDFLGKPASEIFKDRPKVLADFERCYQKQSTVVSEAPYQLVTTGETRYFVTTYNFVPPNLVIDHIQDITEYKQTEAELEECRGQLETLSAGDPAELAEVKATLQREIARREQAEAELARQQAHFETMMAEQSATMDRLKEQLEQEIRKNEEATESLNQSLARLQAQYEGIPIPTYSWQRVDEDFVLVDFNRAAETSTQGRIVNFTGKPASEIFKDRPQVLADLERCFTERKPVVREAPYKLITTGEIRYFVTSYNFVPPDLIICYIRDITRSKRDS